MLVVHVAPKMFVICGVIIIRRYLIIYLALPCILTKCIL